MTKRRQNEEMKIQENTSNVTRTTVERLSNVSSIFFKFSRIRFLSINFHSCRLSFHWIFLVYTQFSFTSTQSLTIENRRFQARYRLSLVPSNPITLDRLNKKPFPPPTWLNDVIESLHLSTIIDSRELRLILMASIKSLKKLDEMPRSGQFSPYLDIN